MIVSYIFFTLELKTNTKQSCIDRFLKVRNKCVWSFEDFPMQLKVFKNNFDIKFAKITFKIVLNAETLAR